jgi:hypothetical protein
MKYRILVAALLAVALCAPMSMALSKMGAPAASLGAGKWSIGADYSYASQNIDFSDLKFDGQDADSDEREGTAKYVKMQTMLAKFEYGVVDNWDVYAALGGAQLKGSSDEEDFLGDVKSSTEPAYGFGTRVTLWQDGALKVGALGQVLWMNNLDDTIKGSDGPDDVWKDKLNVNMSEVQIAFGPTYQLAPGVVVYGGPFADFLQGDFTDKWTETFTGEGTETDTGKVEADLNQAAWFGAYAGVELTLAQNLMGSVEYQHTAFGDCVGANLTFRF